MGGDSGWVGGEGGWVDEEGGWVWGKAVGWFGKGRSCQSRKKFYGGVNPPIDNSMMVAPAAILWGFPPIEYAPLPKHKRILWGGSPHRKSFGVGQADAVVVMI